MFAWIIQVVATFSFLNVVSLCGLGSERAAGGHNKRKTRKNTKRERKDKKLKESSKSRSSSRSFEKRSPAAGENRKRSKEGGGWMKMFGGRGSHESAEKKSKETQDSISGEKKKLMKGRQPRKQHLEQQQQQQQQKQFHLQQQQFGQAYGNQPQPHDKQPWNYEWNKPYPPPNQPPPPPPPVNQGYNKDDYFANPGNPCGPPKNLDQFQFPQPNQPPPPPCQQVPDRPPGFNRWQNPNRAENDYFAVPP